MIRLSARCALGVLAIVAATAAPAAQRAVSHPLTHYLHDAWQIEQGLPQNTVQAIVQTPDGYLWLGTQEGLVRFDGVTFTVFDRQRVPELPGNNIQALFADRAGSLWIGTETGGAARLMNGRFTVFGAAEGLGTDVVRSFDEDAAGAMWVATFGSGLRRFDGQRFVAMPAASESARLSSVEAAADGLWIGSYDAGVGHFAGGRLTSYRVKNGLPADDVRALRLDRAGTLWAGTRHGVATFSHNRWTRLDAGLPDDIVTSLLEDRAGAMWIGTGSSGVFRYAGGTLGHFGVDEGLSAARVRSVFEDREGSVWVGTEGGGLNRLKTGRFTMYGREEHLSSDLAYAIYEDHRGSMWVGTQHDGLNRLEGDHFVAYTKKDGLPSDTILALGEDHLGALWVGTEGGGVARRDGAGRFEPVVLPAALSVASAYALVEDAAGCMWIGTSGRGAVHLCGTQATSVSTRDGLGSDVVFSLAIDRAGALWAGTYGGGLSQYRDGRVTTYTTKNGLGANTIFSIYIDPDETLWAGTYEGGLSRVRDGKITTFDTRQGLASNTIFQVLDDGRGNLWMSSNKGVFRARKTDFEEVARGRMNAVRSIAYGRADGMASVECNGAVQPAGVRARDGRLWFPTIKGVAVIDPAKESVTAAPPPVHVEDLIVDGRPVETANGRETILAPGSANIEIHYAGLSLAAPEAVRFRYRLESYDRDWVDAANRRVAYLTNLGPGHYRFLVTASSTEGAWDPAGAAIQFYLRPYFYQTWWFYALCGLTIAGGAFGGYRLRSRRMRALAARLQALVDARTAELAQVNQELHRLTTIDGLTGVANRRRFDEVLDAEWRRAQRARSPLSLIMLDIDFFGAFNDRYGHLEGDECMKRIAAALGGVTKRANDVVARYGGEEFGVILPLTAGDGARLVADSIRAAVGVLAIPHEASVAAEVVTVSMGVATMVPELGAEPSALVASADQALYRAKHDGRNRIEVAESSSS